MAHGLWCAGDARVCTAARIAGFFTAQTLALGPMRAMGVPFSDGDLPASAAATQLAELLHATDSVLLQLHVYSCRLPGYPLPCDRAHALGKWPWPSANGA